MYLPSMILGLFIFIVQNSKVISWAWFDCQILNECIQVSVFSHAWFVCNPSALLKAKLLFHICHVW